MFALKSSAGKRLPSNTGGLKGSASVFVVLFGFQGSDLCPSGAAEVTAKTRADVNLQDVKELNIFTCYHCTNKQYGAYNEAFPGTVSMTTCDCRTSLDNEGLE